MVIENGVSNKIKVIIPRCLFNFPEVKIVDKYSARTGYIRSEIVMLLECKMEV